MTITGREGVNSEERSGKQIHTSSGANEIQVTEYMESCRGFKRKRKKPTSQRNQFLPQEH